jgi:hypothetical protein
VLVINTGPSVRVAKALHAAINNITPQPVKWAVNVNSQNHQWLGNGYFKSIGTVILAHKEADRVMRDVGETQIASNKTLLKEKAAGTTLTYPDELVDAVDKIDQSGFKRLANFDQLARRNAD